MKCPKCDATLNRNDFEIVVWDDSADVELTCPGCDLKDDPFLSFDQEYLNDNIY